jgi:hypothetical protein
MRRGFVVQDRESSLFLFPHYGDVSFTQWLHEAGRFDDEDSAIETALIHCSEGFHVTEIFEN